jgi:hypothetical protein
VKGVLGASGDVKRCHGENSVKMMRSARFMRMMPTKPGDRINIFAAME